MSKKSKRNDPLAHLKQQLEWWEKEGYDVSELRAKWRKELYEKKPRNQPMTYCSQCGKQLNQTAKFCKDCGFEIDSEEVERAQTIETETHPAVNEKSSGVSAAKRFSGKSVLGLGSLIVGLIFGIGTIVSFFLPWINCSHMWYLSGYNIAWRFTCGGNNSSVKYGGPELALVGSIIMVAFALLAIVTYKKQGIQRIFAKIAQLGAFIALVASIWFCATCWYISYGAILAIVFSSIGFLALLIADLGFWRHRRYLRRLAESVNDSQN